jgi:hypothetical protein
MVSAPPLNATAPVILLESVTLKETVPVGEVTVGTFSKVDTVGVGMAGVVVVVVVGVVVVLLLLPEPPPPRQAVSDVVTIAAKISFWVSLFIAIPFVRC